MKRRLTWLFRCDDCGVIKYGSIKNIKCWGKWKLCRKCAIKAHPEDYAKPYVKRIISITKGIKKKYPKVRSEPYV